MKYILIFAASVQAIRLNDDPPTTSIQGADSVLGPLNVTASSYVKQNTTTKQTATIQSKVAPT